MPSVIAPTLFVTLLLTLVVTSVSAQIGQGPSTFPIQPPQRIVSIVPYSSCAAAIAPPTVIATGDREVPCFQVVITYSNFAPPPLQSKIAWHEFTATALGSDSWCTNSLRARFESPTACAAWWYDRLASGYEYFGLMTTAEKTQCLWWYN